MNMLGTLALSFLLFLQAAAPISSPTEIIRERELQWMTALQDKDFKKLETFLAPEFALYMSDAPSRKVSRDIWLRNSTAYNMSSFSHKEMQVHQVSADVVVASFIHTQVAHPQPPGRPKVDRSGDYYLIDVWKKIDGEWKVSARYSTMAPKAKAE